MPAPGIMAVGPRPLYTGDPLENAILALNPFGWWRVQDMQADSKTIPSRVATGGNLVANTAMTLAVNTNLSSTLPVYTNTNSSFLIDSSLPAADWTFLHDGTGAFLVIMSMYLSVSSSTADQSMFTTLNDANMTGTRGVRGTNGPAGRYCIAGNATATYPFFLQPSGSYPAAQKKAYYYRYYGGVSAAVGAVSFQGGASAGYGTTTGAPSSSAPYATLRLLNNSVGNIGARAIFSEVLAFKTTATRDTMAAVLDPYFNARYNVTPTGSTWFNG